MQQEDKGELGALGRLFLFSMIIHVIFEIAVGLLSQKGIDLPVEVSLVISELTILVPSVIYVLVRNLNFRDDLGFRPIKTGSVFMCMLLSLFVSAIGSFINVLSQFFTSNVMVQQADVLTSGSNMVVWFLAALYGPFCEEFMFRSIFSNRYEKYTGPMRAGFISALLFALAHMNINQASYAFALGVIFSIINKAAGSVYPSMIIHACINGGNILLLMVMTKAAKALGAENDIAEAAEAARGSNMMYILTGTTLVGALVAAAIAIPCVVWMSKHEGKYDDLCDMFLNRHGSQRWLTVSAVAGILFVIFIMFGLNPVISILKEF